MSAITNTADGNSMMDEELAVVEDTGLEMSEANAPALFEKNMALLEEQVPQLFQKLRGYQPVSKLVWLENGEPSIEFQGFKVYEDGALTEAEKQLADMKRYALRLFMNKMQPDGMDIHARAPYTRMIKRFEESGIRFSEGTKRKESYFLIVFGCGLGLHLDALVERTKCRALIIVESNVDFIYHSMSVYDWRPLVERMRARGVIEFLMETNTEITSNYVKSVFRAFNPMGMDSATVFRHQQTSVTREVERLLQEKYRTALMGLGFFQDEVNMMGNTYKNLEGGKARMVRTLPKSPQMPVIVVGTGPSLTGLIPFLKANQDKAVILACGSAIDVIMEHGIQPDFWVMMERSSKIYDQARETAEMFDVSEVRFAGSTTIYPSVPTFFKEALYFFRPGLCPAPLFARSKDEVARVPDPLAANAGLSLGLHLGFREFYFIGVDVGSKDKSRGHAAGSWYERHDAENIKDLGIPLPGNFGGTVWTTSMLQWSKESLENLTKSSPGRIFYNLGDGALIEGVAPKHPKAVKLKPLTRSKVDLVEDMMQQCPLYSTTDFNRSWEHHAIIDRLPEFIEKLHRAVFDDEKMDEFAYSRTVANLLEPNNSSNPMAMLLRGSIFLFFMGFEYFSNRLIDESEREVINAIFKDEFESLMNTMKRSADEVFLSLEDGTEWAEFIE